MQLISSSLGDFMKNITIVNIGSVINDRLIFLSNNCVKSGSLASISVLNSDKTISRWMNISEDSSFLEFCFTDEFIIAVGYIDNTLVGGYSSYIVKFDHDLNVIRETGHMVGRFSCFNNVTVDNNEIRCTGECTCNDREQLNNKITVTYDHNLNIISRSINFPSV